MELSLDRPRSPRGLSVGPLSISGRELSARIPGFFGVIEPTDHRARVCQLEKFQASVIMAVLLHNMNDNTINEVGRTSKEVVPTRIRRFFSKLGPGLITGAADDDPSGIGTYSMAGASLGFATLWTAILTFPLMSVVQFLCAKIGMVSGMGLAGVLRKHYSRAVLYPAVTGLMIANTINVGTDIGAIAAAINLIVPIPTSWMILPIAAIIVAVQMFGSYRAIARIFKWLTLTLFAYIGAAILARPPWGQVFKATFVPAFSWDGRYLMTLSGYFGNYDLAVSILLASERRSGGGD